MDWVITNAPNMLISASTLSMLTRIELDSAALDGAFSTRTAVGLSTALTIGTGSEPGRTVAVPSPCSAGNALTGLAPRRATVSSQSPSAQSNTDRQSTRLNSSH